MKDNKKEIVAANFSRSKEFWKNIYNLNQRNINKCYSADMIMRKEAVFYLLSKHKNKTSLRVLDAGCGPGVFITEAANMGHRVVGVDIAESLTAQLKITENESSSGIAEYIRGDIEYLPFKNNSFDAVLCIGVLSYLNEDAKSLDEIHRVVDNNGVVVIALPNWLRLPMLFDPYYYFNRGFMFVVSKLFHVWKEENGYGELRSYRRYFGWRMQELFRSFNFRVVESINIGFGPPTFWKKEFIPFKFSLKMSRMLMHLSRLSLFSFLKFFANHWVICVQKQQT